MNKAFTRKKEKSGISKFTMLYVSNVMSYMVIGNLTYALTESAGMAAKVVGTIFLISRLLDGLSDLVGGYIIDHTNTRWGKARPFDLVYIPLWLSVVLCFSVPGLSNVGKIIWVFLTYNLSQTVCYTLTNGANPVRLKRSIKEEYRVKAVTVTTIFSMIISLGIGIIMPLLIARFGKQPHGWTIISSIFAVIGIVLALSCFFTLKELPADEKNGEQNVVKSADLSFKESAKILFQNKYVFISSLSFLLFSVLNNMGAISNYYFQYIVGDIKKASVVSLGAALGIIGVLIFPLLQKKFGTKMSCIFGFFTLAAGNMLKIFSTTSIIWLIICNIISSAGSVLAGTTRSLINIDCMSYGQKKSGVELEGVYSAVNGFGDKVGLGLGSWLVGFVMDLGGYDGKAVTQTAGALASIRSLYIMIPAAVAVVAAIIMSFYNEKVVKAD